MLRAVGWLTRGTCSGFGTIATNPKNRILPPLIEPVADYILDIQQPIPIEITDILPPRMQ
jgi:hypothetical protein